MRKTPVHLAVLVPLALAGCAAQQRPSSSAFKSSYGSPGTGHAVRPAAYTSQQPAAAGSKGTAAPPAAVVDLTKADEERHGAEQMSWMGRAGIMLGLVGIAVSTIGGATSPTAPGKGPELTGHLTLSALLMLLGTALAVEGERAMPDPPAAPVPAPAPAAALPAQDMVIATPL